MATARPFVVDSSLTAIAIRYANPAVSLIADKVLPRVPVGGEKFKWLQYALADGFTVPNTAVGRKGRPNQVEFSATEVISAVDDYVLDDMLPQTDLDAAAALRAQGLSIYDPESRAVEGLTDLILLDREIRVANMVFAAATYDAGRQVTLSGTSQFSDYVNSSPIDAINAGLDATLVFRPNKMVIGRPAWTKLRAHPHIVNAVKGASTGRGNATKEEVAELFELDEVIVGEAFLNTARKGQTVSMNRVWGKHISLLHINPLAGPEGNQASFGWSAQFGTRRSGRIPDPNVGIDGGQAVRVGERIKEIVAAPSVGYFIQNAVA